MNPKGSPSDAEKKRSSTSAELQENPTKVVTSIERSIANLTLAFKEFCIKLTSVSIEKEIVLPLFKVYRYVKTNESPSKVAERKLDMSTKESQNQQCAESSNLLAPEKAELNLTGVESEKRVFFNQTSGSSNDEDKNLCLPIYFQEDCKQSWKAELSSVYLLVGCPGRRDSAIDKIVGLYRQLVYLEVFFLYNCLESESSRRICGKPVVPVVSSAAMVHRIKQLEINKGDFDPEKMSSWTDDEFKSKIVSLCGKAEGIMNVLLQLAKLILCHYIRDIVECEYKYYEFLDVAGDVLRNSNIMGEICKSLQKKQLSLGASEILTYICEIDFESAKLCLNLIQFVNSIEIKSHNRTDV